MHSPPSSRIYCPPGYVDREDAQGNVIPAGWRAEGGSGLQPVGQLDGNRCSRSAIEVRETLMAYFNNSPAGALPWQNDYIHST